MSSDAIRIMKSMLMRYSKMGFIMRVNLSWIRIERGLATWVVALVLAGCRCGPQAVKTAALPNEMWAVSDWIAVPDAPVAGETERAAWQAAPGTSWFVGRTTNADDVVSVKWMTTGLGVYELYVNGTCIGSQEALKPGFTHAKKTKLSFTYDIPTNIFHYANGAENVLAAEVSAGWWRDKIVGYAGKKSAFRGVLELTYANGTRAYMGTDADHWTCAVAGPVTRAGIFDGESYDARIPEPTHGGAGFVKPEISHEFTGLILPSEGAEVDYRIDLALEPIQAYCWKGVAGASSNAYGRVVKTRPFDRHEPLDILPGETLVVDFGQNCAAVPAFSFVANPGVTLTCLPGEMLNDANGEYARGNDGPGGSVYRANLRKPTVRTGMRMDYTFASDEMEGFMPRHTFFGYRYLSITATGPVTNLAVHSIPITSIARDLEIGKITTADPDVNRLIANVYWGQLSNYLSVPTDCPQRNERLGWTADTQVFCEAGSFLADTKAFLRKWMRDLRDTQDQVGGFPGVAPLGQFCSDVTMRVGWSDAGIIVPYQVWKQFGDTAIVEENWAAMEKYMNRLSATKADHAANVEQNRDYQWADWLSFEDYESWSGAAWEDTKQQRIKPNARIYWNYLLACYWMWDAQMMADMARATGREPARWMAMADEAKAKLRATFFEKSDGMILKPFRNMQTPALFALKLGLVEGEARVNTLAALRANVAKRNGCLATGFLGTSIIMDTLTECGASDLAYSLLLNHAHPSWLYSVDQGATTIWERWNSYTKEKGFGPVGMNSFNHYAYGAVLGWLFKTAAGIAADPAAPGFKSIVMRPIPDRRLGAVSATYNSAAGRITSAWRYAGERWIWEFTVPNGAHARVTVPGEMVETIYEPGTYRIER